MAETAGTGEHAPFELDRTIELIRAAFMEAMREHGLFVGARMAISARAELHIAEALHSQDDEERQGPTGDVRDS